MQETRRQRLQAVILEELSVVVREVKDPRVGSVTFTSVEVTPDGSQATVYISLLGASQVDSQDRAATKLAQLKAKDCVDGLQSASGFLRRHLAKVLTVRHIPTLIFKEDRGFENTIRVHELLKKINSEDGAPKTGASAERSDSNKESEADSEDDSEE